MTRTARNHGNDDEHDGLREGHAFHRLIENAIADSHEEVWKRGLTRSGRVSTRLRS